MARADEMDCMFLPVLPSDWLHVTYKGAPPGFCFVELKSPTGGPPPDQTLAHEELKDLCCNGCVSSKKFREKVFTVFGRAVKEKRRARGNTRPRHTIHTHPRFYL